MKRVKKAASRVARTVERSSEEGARRAVLEDLFYDFNRSRAQVFRMNFFRGIFFGLGSVVGGTIVVAVLVWVMSLFVELPGIGGSVKQVQESIESSQRN